MFWVVSTDQDISPPQKKNLEFIQNVIPNPKNISCDQNDEMNTIYEFGSARQYHWNWTESVNFETI